MEKKLKEDIVKSAAAVNRKVDMIREAKNANNLVLDTIVNPIVEPLKQLANKNDEKQESNPALKKIKKKYTNASYSSMDNFNESDSEEERGINELDTACMYHDIAYNNSDLNIRQKADLELLNMAKKRLKSKDAGKGEKAAAWIVKNAMKAKLKAGSGVRSFMTVVKKIQSKLKKIKSKDKRTTIKHALAAAKKLFTSKKGIRLPRYIPIPKCGGMLPLIPIFAGLSALGSLAGCAAGIAKAVNDYKTAQKNLQESERHNKVMEDIALGKGLFIKSHKKGSGLYLNSSKN